jgi:predicted PhzF superfamily epimerase YddE/YHI9
MGHKIFTVDAFTDKPFSGNPAGVCILSKERDDLWLQSVAREMNLSETAFLTPEDDEYKLRWFTPKVEVDLCGHATLASAHILFEKGYLKREEQAKFHTRSGLLTAITKESWIELDFPKQPVIASAPPNGLVESLKIKPKFVGNNALYYIVEVDSEAIVRGLKPDYGRLTSVPVNGVAVTSKASTPGFDFVSRFFAPKFGIDEDPVTGSSHCGLGPFWEDRLHKSELTAYQASARGGVIHVRVASNRVYLGGKAVTILEGELCT